VSLDIDLEAVIEQVWSFAIGGHHHANLEAILE
jgi:hypothetical protein